MATVNTRPRAIEIQTPSPITSTVQATTTVTTTTGLNSILVLHYKGGYNGNQALVTNVAGDVTELDWETEGQVHHQSHCEVTFMNEMYLYGQV